jgi:hypothetical protein
MVGLLRRRQAAMRRADIHQAWSRFDVDSSALALVHVVVVSGADFISGLKIEGPVWVAAHGLLYAPR